ncbi:MAG: Transcriptional activator protein CzcR [Syntrophorhabdaceae bacterium PtaU1.Bin034]|nr:MAG: Transcriptional activator protein CzcR [Syntrophorhabdaceae bacterium PtaU1.Bin034]
MKILIVEDEKKVASFVRKGLQEEGYSVDMAHNGEDGLHLASDASYDLIILDIYLPKLDGISVLKKLREFKVKTPVLLLTVRATIEDKVLGLDSGADDYLTKPFAFEELLARVRALLRRRSSIETEVLRVADLTLDPARHIVTRGTRTIELTLKEFSLLQYLMENAGRVVTRTMIIDRVWNYDFDSETNVVDVYVNYLRKKIDTDSQPKLIHTVRGVGYVMKVE